MTGSAADPPAYQPHVRNKMGMDDLARRYRDPGADFQLVIVRDMWLTGFDCPSIHTLSIDHNRVIDALQVIEELIRIGRDLRAEPDDGLTPEEVALYDALAENGSAVELMGNAELRLIASKLVKAVANCASFRACTSAKTRCRKEVSWVHLRMGNWEKTESAGQQTQATHQCP